METELSRVVDALPGFVWTAYPDGQIDFLNRRWCDYTGLALGRSCGRGWQAAVHPEDLSGLLTGWQDVAAAAPVETEARVRGAGGDYRWFLFHAHPSADASGQVVKWSGMSTDIDERKQTAEALRALAAIDDIPGFIAILAPNGYIETVNHRLLEYCGYAIEELRQWATNGTIHSEDLPHVVEILNKSIASGVPYEIEHRMRRHDGAYLWLSNRGIPARNDAGQIVRWHVLLTDIEDRKRAEALLAGEKQLLEMVASGHPMPDTLEALCRLVESTASGSFCCSIVLADPGGTKLQEAIAPSLAPEFNDAVRGWPLDRLGGPCVMAARDKMQVIMSDVASDERWRNSWRALAQKHGLRSCWSTPMVSQAGKVLGTFALYQREPGTPSPLQLELIAQFTNIASIAIERAQRDAALRHSQARLAEAERDLRQTIDTIPVFVAAYRPDGTRSFVNRTWQEYMGLSLEEATGPNAKAFPHFDPADAEAIDKAWRGSLASGQPLLVEARVRRADGQYRRHTSHRVPLRDEEGNVVRWYSVGIDIEDRKAAEDALRLSEARLAEAERELRLTLDSIPTMTWRADQVGHVLSGNKRWFDYTGSTLEQVRDRRWQSFVHPDDLAALLEDGKPSIPAGNSAEAEARVRRFDGEYRWFLFRAEAARDESGEIVAWYGTITDVEDKKRADDALRLSETRLAEAERELQLMVDSIPAMVGVLRPDGTLVFVNQTYRDYTGLSMEEATSGTRKDIHPDDAERIRDPWRDSLTTGQPFQMDLRLRRSDGAYRWHTLRRVPLRDEKGVILRWYGVASDIEERKAAEDALRGSEARLAGAERKLQLTINTIPTLVATYRPDGLRDFVNQTWLDYTGLSFDNAMSVERTIHPDDAARVTQGWQTALADEVPFKTEMRLRRADGEYRWHSVHRVLARDETGAIVKWYSVGVDIEERKRAEEALRRSELNSRSVIDGIPGLVATLTPGGEVEAVNRQIVDYCGQQLDELKNWGTNGTVHEADLPDVAEIFSKSIASGVAYKIEQRLRRFDGEYLWFDNRGIPVRDEAGQIVRWYVLLTDIEDRKRAEEALRESERNSRLIVDGIPGQVAIFTPGGEFEFVNRQIIEYFGTTLEDVTSKRHRTRETLHPEDLPRATELFKQSMASGEPFEFEVRGRRFDGVYRWFQSRGIPLRDTNGRIFRWLNLLIDIDERKHAEEALRQSEAELAEAERELRVTLDSIPAITWRAGANGYVQQLNKRWFEYTGTTHEQVRGWRWKLCVHPDDLDQLVELGSKYVTTGEAVDSEARLRRFDGEYRWFLFRPAPVRDESGRVVAWYGTITDIEDRKQAEAKVREAEGELQHMLDSIPAMIVRGGANGYIQYFSKQWFEYTGTTIETARGFRWHQALHPDDRERLVEFGARFVATAEPGDCEARLRRFDGEYRWFLFRPAAVHDSAGNFVGWYGTVTDIEDRKQAEEKAGEAERELQRTIDTIPALVGTYTGDGVRQSVNKWAREYTGLSVETWMEAFHPDDAASIEAQWRECLTKGEPLEREHRVLAADGTYRWLLTRRVPLRDEAGKVIRWYGIAHDIEDRKRAEDALRTSELDLRKIVDSVPALAWSARLDGSAEFCNQSYVDYTGLSLEQLQNWGFSNAVHPDDVDQVGREYRAILASGRTGETEARLRRHDGEYRWFTFRATPLRDENGQPVKWYGIGYDVEERKRAEEELRRSETLLAEGQRISSTGTYAWGGDLTERMLLSEEFYRIFEFEQDSAVTFTQLIERFHPEDVPLMAERIERIDAGLENPEFQIRLRMPDSRIKYLRVLGRVIRHQDGRLERIGAVQDITRNRQAEEALDKVRTELAHVTRVMSLGALTASIAHEVNQPLAGIVTNASTCLRMLAADPPNVEGARETARRTIRDGNRAADVITRLRALFSKKAAAPEIVDLGEVAQEILALVSTDLLRGRIIVRAELGEPLLVTGDRVQLQQVILNLVRNAMDAMSGVYDRPRDLLIRTDTEEDEARLIVKDAGVGIEAQTAERLFDAFYTTKSDGMGIGLSVSRSIVESHGGRLWVEPHDGPGATFAFSIPRQATSGADDGTAGAILTRPARGAHDLAGNA